MAATKPDKIREETYDFIVKALKESMGKTPVGRSQEGIVYENHLDGEHVVIKVIKKKNPIAENEISPILTYKEKLTLYEAEKEEKRKQLRED
jgi:hypothetical protein